MKWRPFTSSLSKNEAVAVLIYMPVHLAVLPTLLSWFCFEGMISEPEANLLRYVIGAAYIIIIARGFLRRDFDSVCDRPFFILIQVVGSYLAYEFFNIIFSLIGSLFFVDGNPNNQMVESLAHIDFNGIKAMAIFLAPIVEECLFRAGIFGLVRRKNRVLAYIISIILFSVYHVLTYAFDTPISWLYVLQYIPASFLLCRCYEQTDTIWTPIFLHMMINAVSMGIMEALL